MSATKTAAAESGARLSQPGEPGWYAILPGVFVIFWATGFIAGKLGLPHAGPFTFLSLRFMLVIALLTLIALAMRAPWPKREALIPIAIGGLFVHAGYLGMTFAAISVGVEAGVSAMMAGLQPLLTAAVAAPLLGETVTKRQWMGLLLGLAGVALVLQNKLSLGLGTPLGMLFAFMSAVMMTAGTLWQKRFGGAMDLRTGSVVQFAASLAVTLPLALYLENFRHDWTSDFIIAMAWLVIVLSVGTIFVLFTVIKRGAISKVASLFFLVPPATALMAWILFNETLGPLSFLGMLLIVIAVAMVTWTGKTWASKKV